MSNKMILVYGKPCTYKTTISKYLQSSISDNSCYLDFEKNKYTINDIIKCLSLYDVVVVDYIELLNIDIDNIKLLRDIVKNTNRTLIMVSCCSSDKDLLNPSYYDKKKLFDIMVLLDN